MPVPSIERIKILLGTANPKKVEEISSILSARASLQLLTLRDFPAIPDPEETGETFSANAELKARYYYEATGLPTLADDSGLCVDALEGRPGIYSARYGTDDNDRIRRLLTELKEQAGPRTAYFLCAMAFYVAPGKMYTSIGKLHGEISETRAGEHGFGYDPIFHVPVPFDRRLAELEPAEKNAISHRSLALKSMVPQILDWAKTLNEHQMK